MALPTSAGLTVTSATGADQPDHEPPARANLGPASGLQSRETISIAAHPAQSYHRTDTSALGDAGRVGRQVRVPKTAELVAAHLRRQIVRGELVEGDALPPEAVLMEQFGVSRPTLREAFRVLESEALISVRRGAHGGARVHTPNGDVAARYAGLVLEHRGTTLADVHRAMALLEPACARELATADQAALAQLNAVHQQGAPAPDTDPQQVLVHHGYFHQLLVDLAGNQTVTVLAAMIRHILEQTNLGEAHPMTGSDAVAAAHDHYRAHARLLELLGQGDADAAETHWRSHVSPAHPAGDMPLLDLLG
jgi:DNA-binding FadR family transcriptional regulator